MDWTACPGTVNERGRYHVAGLRDLGIVCTWSMPWKVRAWSRDEGFVDFGRNEVVEEVVKGVH